MRVVLVVRGQVSCWDAGWVTTATWAAACGTTFIFGIPWLFFTLVRNQRELNVDAYLSDLFVDALKPNERVRHGGVAWRLPHSRAACSPAGADRRVAPQAKWTLRRVLKFIVMGIASPVLLVTKPLGALVIRLLSPEKPKQVDLAVCAGPVEPSCSLSR